MIQDWRRNWEQGDFPFFWVQLANFKTTSGNDWVLVKGSRSARMERVVEALVAAAAEG